MHMRFKQRREEILAARSEFLALSAEQLVGELHTFAALGDAPLLAALAISYQVAIDNVRRAIRSGAAMAPVLQQFEASGREVVAALMRLQASIPSRAGPAAEASASVVSVPPQLSFI